MKSHTPVGASSATYRKVVNRLAQELREPAVHTRYPSDDFQALAKAIDPVSRKRALRWYKRGIRRGFIEACDAILDRQLKLKKNVLRCPPKVSIFVKVRFAGQRWSRMNFRFDAEDLDFE